MTTETETSSDATPAASGGAARRRFPASVGLSTRLLAIILVAALPAVGLAFWTARVERERRSADIRRQTVRLAGLVASEHRRIMDTGRGVLVAVAHLPQVLDPARAESCNAVLGKIHEYYRIYANIGVADLAGNIVCSAAPPPPGVNLRDRKYFEEALRTGDFTVGEYQISRITNRPSISFAYPVENEAGEPEGVVIAALDLSVLAWVAEQMLTQLPKGSVFTMLDRAGTVIARKPDGAQMLGSPLSDQALLAKVLSKEGGTQREETADGALLHAHFPVLNPLRAEEWYTIISLPETALHSPLESTFEQNLMVLGLVVVVTAALSHLLAKRLVMRPASKILEATRQMERGNLGVRIGPQGGAGELGELARSFDRMAAALDQRERQLEDNQARLSDLSRRLLAAQEDERRRIARELHDELGQFLTGAKINLVSLQGGTAQPHADFDPLDDTLELVGRALATVRELSTELRPAILDDAGLEEALHWLLARVSNRTGISGHVDAEPLGDDVAAEVQTALFRVTQEALTNVTRHAAATTVEIYLRRLGSYVELSVLDDGQGFDVGAALERALGGSSLGLVAMEERIALAGGTLEIDSAPGRGTRLKATVPAAGSAFETDGRREKAAS